jgi:hypothetical protein
MTAEDFYDIRVRKAKEFGFPTPIFVNAEKLTERTRVIYLVEIQSTIIPDETKNKTHHYSLRFSKFKKIKTEPFWEEENVVSDAGFAISDRNSLRKLATYIKANESLLDIDVLHKEYTSVILSNSETATEVVRQVLQSGKNKEEIFHLFKEEYPELDRKILTYKLVQARNVALGEFRNSLEDVDKKERNYWQPFLETNKWVFGLSYLILLDESRLDLWDTADYLFKSEDGFIDIIEIKHPHLDFWQHNGSGHYEKYRDFLQPSEELKGAITQATNYIFQTEKKFFDPDWCRRNNCENPVKPKCTVVLGRSVGWGLAEATAFRLLNDSLHGVQVITFDHLYKRAEKLQISLEEES